MIFQGHGLRQIPQKLGQRWWFLHQFMSPVLLNRKNSYIVYPMENRDNTEEFMNNTDSILSLSNSTSIN